PPHARRHAGDDDGRRPRRRIRLHLHPRRWAPLRPDVRGPHRAADLRLGHPTPRGVRVPEGDVHALAEGRHGMTDRGREAGYSLLELLIVCAMITIVANIAIPGMYEGIYRAKASAIMEDFNLVRTTVHQHYADHSFYPPEVGPGTEPPELTPYLQSRLHWTHPDYQYDWELWVDDAGNPTQPATGVLVG